MDNKITYTTPAYIKDKYTEPQMHIQRKVLEFLLDKNRNEIEVLNKKLDENTIHSKTLAKIRRHYEIIDVLQDVLIDVLQDVLSNWEEK